MYTLDSSWTYLILAVGITLYSFYTGVQEKKRRAEKSNEVNESDNLEDDNYNTDFEERLSSLFGDRFSNVEQKEVTKESNKSEVLDEQISKIDSVSNGDSRFIKYADRERELVVDNSNDIENLIIEPNPDRENIITFKDRLRRNPKDLVLYSEILRAKYQDF